MLALLRRVQTALKPAAKTLGLHRIFMRGMGHKQAIAHGASKRMQVVARACSSILTSIIEALHIGQAGRPIGANGMTDDRR